MRAMVLEKPAPAESHPLRAQSRALPEPGPGDVRVRVEVCGVCRTDLHVVEGDLGPRRPSIVPGHEIVGQVDARGEGATRFAVGDRVGVAWLHRACGRCRFCARGAENLCLEPVFTGWEADGGYAEYTVAPEDFAYALPGDRPARELAPLLCAGIIGYRAYLRTGILPGARLGIYGFGGSAHIAIQVARHHGCEVYVFSRGDAHRELAEELGAAWIGGTQDAPPHELDAAILFAPAGEIVPTALEALDRGGVLSIAGIHLSDVPPLDYQRHLFQEREIRSVTANTREDGRALLALATEIPIRTHTVLYPLEEANRALVDLKQDRVQGAAVLAVDG
ncbi:MAG: zinc-dependent alcohol dehydrogenase family protein [Proteobacteria bacterium]|nr:zinc-dependent alcohol dehydrogenase family protein [Pseudomonadota bacterium]